MKPGMRVRDEAAWERVRAILATDGADTLTHAEVARQAATTYEVVRAVRRSLGVARGTGGRPRSGAPGVRVQPVGRPPRVRIASKLSTRHAEILTRLFAAHDRGSDLRVQAILNGADAQELRRCAEAAAQKGKSS